VPRWAAFLGLALAVTVLLLVLSRRSERAIDDLAGSAVPAEALLLNVAATHGLFAALLVAGAVLAGIPPSALGVDGVDPGAVGIGVVVGLCIAAASVLAGRLLDADPSARLRRLLSPASRREWAVLLGVALPVVAGFEELLFRAALVGAPAAGLDVSPWLLAVGSSVVFAAGHGAQGRVGIAVTGLVGAVLAAVFLATGSLLVVVVAHYVVNAAEFLTAEWLGYAPSAASAESPASKSP